MLVRFTKDLPTAPADRIACVRTDGTMVHAELPRQGILPHLAFHFVVEAALGWHDALFGRVIHGHSLEADANKVHGAVRQRVKNIQALQCESLIECLEAEQWGGAADPAGFALRLLQTCRRHAVPPPDLTAEEVERVRLALREFGAAWRPLAPGGSLERTFGT